MLPTSAFQFFTYFIFLLFFLINPLFSWAMRAGERVNSKLGIYIAVFRVNGVGESLNLSRPKSLNLGPPPEHDSKPTDLSVPRPQSLNLFSSSSSRPKTLPLLMQRPNSLQFARRPVSLEVGGSDDGGNDEPLNLESPVKFKQLLVAASESQNQQPQVMTTLCFLHITLLSYHA